MWSQVLCYNGLSFPDVDSSQPVYYNRRLGLWLWKMASGMSATNLSAYAGKWVMKSSFPMMPVLGGSQAVYVFSQFEGYPIYYVGGKYLWQSSGWYHSALVGGGIEEYTNEDAPTVYLGDSWYFGSILSASLDGRGLQHGNPETVSWQAFLGKVLDSTKSGASVAPYGVYISAGGGSGDRYVGCLELSDSLGNKYTQIPTANSLRLIPETTGTMPRCAMQSDRHDNMGDLAWSDTLSLYIIGTYSTAQGTGYWKGSAVLPKDASTSPATFERVWNPVDPQTDPPTVDPTPENITVSFSKWKAPATSWKKPGLFLETGVPVP